MVLPTRSAKQGASNPASLDLDATANKQDRYTCARLTAGRGYAYKGTPRERS